MVSATSRPVSLAAALTAVLVLASPGAVFAQCFGPDNLDIGLCCQSIDANLPLFPAAAPSALGICWQQCSQPGTQDLLLSWSPPTQIACGQYVAQLTVSDAGSGAALLTGTLNLDYTRTWIETDPNGVPIQVWRFVAKADLSAVAGGMISLCVMPSCITPSGPYNTAFYYGYLDYAGCNAAGGWQNSLVLYHACDRFIHMGGLSDKPGTFHPDGSYALVAPHSSLQPFVPAVMLASGGPVLAEAARDAPGSTAPGNCTVEDPVAHGLMKYLGAGCICSMSKNPKLQSLRDFSGVTTCIDPTGAPGSWATVDLGFPAVPWLHLVSTSIGRWSSPASYPGTEACWVDEGVFAMQDACTGGFAEIRYGASTRSGWTPKLPLPVAVDNFTDLASNYSAPLFGPYPMPVLGSVKPTQHLLYVNLP